MALDAVSLEMIASHLRGNSILCLGYPDMPNGADAIAHFALGGAVDVDVVDVIAHRGVERFVDLNEPQVWPRCYGLVINPGTLEHCFNLGVAWANAWSAVVRGGAILHVAPATMLNHGFWNLNPLAIYSWCEANGGEVVQIKFARNGSATIVNTHRIGGSQSGRGALPEETVLYALCRKHRDVPCRWPAQGIYAK